MTKRNQSDVEEYLSPRDAAKLAFVSSRTLARLGEAGQITVVKLPSGHRRYLRSDIENLLTKEHKQAS